MDDSTAEIKQAVNIVDLIGEYLRLEPIGAKFRGLCPFHDDHKPSFQVDPQHGSFRCWACGAKGDAYTFLQQIEHVSFLDAKKRLAERAGIVLRPSRSKDADREESLRHVLDWAAKQFQKCLMDSRIGSEARQYLHERGLHDETARTHGIGFAPGGFDWLLTQAQRCGHAPELLVRAGLAKVGNLERTYDTFRARLMFPIRNDRGQIVGFGGRILPSTDDGQSPKYLNTPTTDVYNKSQVLYGIDVAVAAMRGQCGSRAAGRRTMVVMEGYTDCLMAYQHGLMTAVATCGTAMTSHHVKRLRTFADEVVLVFDGDAAGQKAAAAATALFLQSEVDLKLCTLPGGQDPCDFIRSDGIDSFRQLLGHATDPLEHHIWSAKQQHDMSTVQGRQQALASLETVLARVPPMLRGSQNRKFNLALSRIKEAFGIDEREVRLRIDKSRWEARSPVQPKSGTDTVPMSKTERHIVSWMVARPDRAAEFRDIFPVSDILHIDLKSLAEACYALADEAGCSATVDRLRERINDPQLDALIIQFLDEVPTDERYERGLADIRASLFERRRRIARNAIRERAARGDDASNLAILRQAHSNRSH